MFIQQESTFWRKCIWEKAGGYISTDYKFASDYELWSRFIQLAPLYGIAALIGGFRLRTNNLSLINIEEYLKEMVYIRSKMLISTSERLMIFILLILNLFVFRYFDKIGLIRRFKRYCFNLPPDIFFNRHNQEFEIKE